MNEVNTSHFCSTSNLLIQLFIKHIFLILFLTSSFLLGQKEYHPEHSEVLDRITKILHYENRENIDSLNLILNNSGNACLQTLAIHYEASYDYLIKNRLVDAKSKSLECIKTAEINRTKMHKACYESSVRVSVIRLFYLYRRMGEFEKALHIVQNHKNKFKPYEIEVFSATNQLDMENYVEAIKGFKKALIGIRQETKPQTLPEIKLINLSRTSSIYQSIADAFLEIYKTSNDEKLLDSANLYYRKSRNSGNKFNSNLSYNDALYNSKLARIEYYRGNYKSAIKYYNTYFDHEVIHENSFTFQAFCLGLAQNYLKLKKPDQSLKYLAKLDSAYAVNPGSKQFFVAGLSTYMDVYQQKGNSEKALQHAKLYLENIQKIDQNKINAREYTNIINIDESNEKAQKIIESKNNWMRFLSILGVILIGVILFIIWFYKVKHQRNQTLSIQTIQSMKEERKLKDNLLFPREGDVQMQKPKTIINDEAITQLKRKMAEIEKNNEFLKQEFKLPYLAKKLGTNTSYLSSFFNESIEKNFNQYLQEKRMEYLLELLANNRLYRKYTVQAISEHIGYKSPSAFGKIFKKHTGVNYSTYLENLEIKNTDI